MTRHHLLTTVLATLLVAAGAVRFAAADEPATPIAAAEAKPQAMGAAKIAALVEQLDSNRYVEREEATQALLGAGSAALDPLLAAANSDRPETADRAVWVLKKMGNSPDRDFALAALDRLVQVKARPGVVADARQTQSRLREAECEELLAKLGGRLTVISPTPGTITPELAQIRLVRVELSDDWRGTTADLECLIRLDQHQYFRLVGPRVGDDELRLFESKDNLTVLQVFMSHVTPAAVDSLKNRHPKATVYVRNRALVGIGGESPPHESGVRVTRVQDGTGAAAADVAVGDVITAIEGKPLEDFDRLTAQIAQFEPGDVVDMTVRRGEDVSTKRITLGDQPPE